MKKILTVITMFLFVAMSSISFARGPKDNPNSNGVNREDRKTGLDRAHERMSDEGLEHSKAQENKEAKDKNEDEDKDSKDDKDSKHDKHLKHKKASKKDKSSGKKED
ncbi:MAG: hypothetical protein RLZZ564_711 [Pseudomonadota bacterium]|jgi:hypothetical protein